MILALITLIANHAAHAAPATLSLPSSNSSLTLLTGFDSSIYCSDSHTAQEIEPDDCRAATLQLPKDHPRDVYYSPHYHQYLYPAFSQFPNEERHRLPKRAELGTCAVEVRLAEGAICDNSSWRIIMLRLGQVLQRCVGSMGVGGWTMTGEEKDIEVRIYAMPAGSGIGSMMSGNVSLAVDR